MNLHDRAVRLSGRAALAASLTLGVFAALPAATAQADEYTYCPGYVIQWHSDGSYVAYWYDNVGNYGEVPGPRLNHDLVCG